MEVVTMLSKKFGIVAVVLVLMGMILSATPGRASAETAILHLNLASNSRLDQMMITERGDIEFYGHNLEAEGICLPAQIFVEGERSSWWPLYTCAKVNEAGEWFLRVPSDEGQPVEIFFNMP
jgi:hypothetical protein